MITLHQPPAAWGLPNMSPFCVKLETYLRMTGIEYKVAPADIRQAPKGRVPYVDLDGKLVGDSSQIIDLLKSRHGDPLDAKLSKEQRAFALAIQRMFEDHLYFGTAWLRWSRDDSFAYVEEVFKSEVLPPVIGGLIMKVIRKSFRKALTHQGVGDHSEEEIIAFAKQDLSAISDLLGDKPYFLGNEPTSIDATAYGFLIQLLWVPWESPVKPHLAALPNLTRFCERMKQKYWS